MKTQTLRNKKNKVAISSTIGIILAFSIMILGQVFLELGDSYTKEVPCYDAFNNKIIGQVCVEKIYENVETATAISTGGLLLFVLSSSLLMYSITMPIYGDDYYRSFY